MKAGNDRDPGVFHYKKYAVGKPAHSCPPPSFIHYRKTQRCGSDGLNAFVHGFRES